MEAAFDWPISPPFLPIGAPPGSSSINISKAPCSSSWTWSVCHPKVCGESPFTWLNWKPVPRASRLGNQLAVRRGALPGVGSESLASGSRLAAVVVVGKDALTGAW